MINALRLGLIVPVLLLGMNVASAGDDRDELHQNVQTIKKDWQKKDGSFNSTLEKAYAYAIFPRVGKEGEPL